MDINPKLLKKVMSALAKEGHRKNPRPKEYYQMINKKSQEAKRKKKLLTPARTRRRPRS